MKWQWMGSLDDAPKWVQEAIQRKRMLVQGDILHIWRRHPKGTERREARPGDWVVMEEDGEFQVEEAD